MQYFAESADGGAPERLFRRLHSESPLEEWDPAVDEWRGVTQPVPQLSTVRSGQYTRVRAQVHAVWRAQRRRQRHLKPRTD